MGSRNEESGEQMTEAEEKAMAKTMEAYADEISAERLSRFMNELLVTASYNLTTGAVKDIQKCIVAVLTGKEYADVTEDDIKEVMLADGET